MFAKQFQNQFQQGWKPGFNGLGRAGREGNGGSYHGNKITHESERGDTAEAGWKVDFMKRVC